MHEHISIRFYAELNDFLATEKRQSDIKVHLKQSRSVKDLIESSGVPHTEINLVLVNGETVLLDHLVHKGDQVSVFPLFRTLDISTLQSLQTKPPLDPSFVLDVHLGKLAASLRMLGFDTLYHNNYDDPTLATISANEQRILLTCDRQLLMRKIVTAGYYVRAREPHAQLLEVLSRFNMANQQKPFSRCMNCNGNTHTVEKQEVSARLPAETRKYYSKFYQCEDCHKIYWKGSHYLKMQQMISKINSTLSRSGRISDFE